MYPTWKWWHKGNRTGLLAISCLSSYLKFDERKWDFCVLIPQVTNWFSILSKYSQNSCTPLTASVMLFAFLRRKKDKELGAIQKQQRGSVGFMNQLCSHVGFFFAITQKHSWKGTQSSYKPERSTNFLKRHMSQILPRTSTQVCQQHSLIGGLQAAVLHRYQ